MKYVVDITEILTTTVVVEAESYGEAEDKAVCAYDAGKIVLDSEDWFDTTFEAFEYDEWQHSLCKEL